MELFVETKSADILGGNLVLKFQSTQLSGKHIPVLAHFYVLTKINPQIRILSV